MFADRFCIITMPAKAKRLGATHAAFLHGVVPGYFNPETSLWIPASDCLNWLDTMLAGIWVWTREARGEEPDLMIRLWREI